MSSRKHLFYVEEGLWWQEICVHILQTKKNKKNKSQTGIPEIVKATGNVTATDASAVNAELESSSKEKGGKGSSYNTSLLSGYRGIGKICMQQQNLSCNCSLQIKVPTIHFFTYMYQQMETYVQ